MNERGRLRTEPLFLLGAGFNGDAATEFARTSASSPHGHRQPSAAYPLVSDLKSLCFGLRDLPHGESIEGLFQRAMDRRDTEPMRRLVDVVQEADYYLASGLSCAADPLGNCYLDFFSDFQTSSYLTFNYDSLPELFLMKLGRWDPRTGYGVSVRVGLQPTGSVQPVLETGSLVLHLHGTFCLETEEFSRPTMPPMRSPGSSPCRNPSSISSLARSHFASRLSGGPAWGTRSMRQNGWLPQYRTRRSPLLPRLSGSCISKLRSWRVATRCWW